MITGKIDQTMKVENNLMNRQEIDLQMISDGVKQETLYIAIRLFFVCIANQAPTKLFPIVQAPVIIVTHFHQRNCFAFNDIAMQLLNEIVSLKYSSSMQLNLICQGRFTIHYAILIIHY